MTTSLLSLSWVQWGLWVLLSCQITILCVTLYLHRGQAHRALELHPLLAHFARGWLWLSTGMSTRQWVAVHRKHHAHCDTAQDPHSPQVQGLFNVLFKGVALYRREAQKEETLVRYGKGAPDDALERRLYARHPLLGPGLFLAAHLVVLGPVQGLAAALVIFAWIPWWAAGVINGLGHARGYRNFDTADHSRNLLPWGVWIGGEELHNNHHAHPTSAKLSWHPWEVDLGWGVLRALQALKLARVLHVSRPASYHAERRPVDRELFSLLARRRLELEHWYRQTWRQCVMRLRQSGVLSREDAQRLSKAHPKALASESLENLLHLQPQLKHLHEHWHGLEQMWTDKTSSPQDLVRRLAAWLEAAEHSGLEPLARLGARLRHLQA